MKSAHNESPACADGRVTSSGRDIGALFRRHGEAYRRANSLGLMERRALRDISVCRTGALGGHRDVCGRCGHERTVYNSCRNRHCPKCQALRQARWVAARMQRALRVRHFHGNLIFHPHLHCIVTGGGLGADGAWVKSLERYLLPVEVLGMLFRGKFLDGLTHLFEEGKLAPTSHTPQAVAELVKPEAFARLKNELYKKKWVVHAKTPFRKPDALFRYLGLYTHRVAISNHRLLHVDDHEVVFRTRGKQVCRLAPLEFMHRFLEHVLPRGFVKIRHFGLYAAGSIHSKLVVARSAIESSRRQTGDNTPASPLPVPVDGLDWRALFQKLTGIDLGACPRCGGSLVEQPLADGKPPARASPLDSS